MNNWENRVGDILLGLAILAILLSGALMVMAGLMAVWQTDDTTTLTYQPHVGGPKEIVCRFDTQKECWEWALKFETIIGGYYDCR